MKSFLLTVLTFFPLSYVDLQLGITKISAELVNALLENVVGDLVTCFCHKSCVAVVEVFLILRLFCLFFLWAFLFLTCSSQSACVCFVLRTGLKES